MDSAKLTNIEHNSNINRTVCRIVWCSSTFSGSSNGSRPRFVSLWYFFTKLWQFSRDAPSQLNWELHSPLGPARSLHFWFANKSSMSTTVVAVDFLVQQSSLFEHFDSSSSLDDGCRTRLFIEKFRSLSLLRLADRTRFDVDSEKAVPGGQKLLLNFEWSDHRVDYSLDSVSMLTSLDRVRYFSNRFLYRWCNTKQPLVTANEIFLIWIDLDRRNSWRTHQWNTLPGGR